MLPIALQSGGFAFGGAMFFIALLFLVIGLVSTLVWLYATYWTYNDAKRRGMDEPAIWAIVVFATNLVGLVVYLIVRE